MTAPPDTAARPGPAREIAFELNGRHFSFKAPPPGDPTIPSVFFVGLPKAGSTLLNGLMRPITIAAGLSFLAPQEILFSMGVAAADIPSAVNAVFAPRGHAFGGFRSLPAGFSLPSFAANRTIVLVRDPRDMLTSLYFSLARSHRAPGKAVGEAAAAAFSEQREEVNRTSIDAFVLERAKPVAHQFRALANKLSVIPRRLYKYEDVIFEKASWARDMVDYLGLTVTPGVIEAAVAAHDLWPDAEDATRHVRRVVPGDHREKLRPETIDQLNARLEPILRRYRYL